MKTKYLIPAGIVAAMGLTALVFSYESGKNPPSGSAPRSVSVAAGKVTRISSAVSSPAAGNLTKNAPSRASVVPHNAAPLAEPIPADATTARITIGGKTQTVVQDEIGNYPVINIEAKKTIPVSLSFPKGQPDDAVLVRIEDGGRLNAKDAAKLLSLDPKKTINFDFASNSDNGIYRIVVTKGSETSVLQFWVGPEMPHSQRTLETKTASSH